MMERKKIDITPLVYVTLMIVVFLLGSCSTPKRVIPAAKYHSVYMLYKLDTTSLEWS